MDLKAPDCEKIDILNAFFSLNFSNTMTTFMATFMATFTATLLWRLTFKFLSFSSPLYDFNLILLASQRASLAKGEIGRTHRPPPLATRLVMACFPYYSR